jgi:hypothetical protein
VYVLGATHNLSGSGIVTLSSSRGLLIRCTSAPVGLSQKFTHPATLYGLGSVRVGDANGWLPGRALQSAADLIYPLPIDATRLGYDLSDGVAAQAVELNERPLLDWIDRNPAIYTVSQVYWNPANQPNSVGWTFQVPTGRRFVLASARVQILRMSAEGTPGAGSANGNIVLAGVGALVNCYSTPNVRIIDDRLAGPMALQSGASLLAYYNNSEGSGGTYVTLSMSGTLVDV